VFLVVTKQREHVKHRRRRGFCAHEGCPRPSGDKYRCPAHTEAHAAEERARYWAKREQKAKAAA
jgi:hypothetical protein